MQRIPVEAGVTSGASAWVELDLAALRANVAAFRARLRPGCSLTAVVKANAYGHGVAQIVPAVLQAGVDRLGVATVAEGVALREQGVQAPILLLGPLLPEQCAAVVEHRLLPCLGSREAAEALAAVVPPGTPLPVHVEIDTGMRRHGVPAAAFGAFVQALRDRGRLRLTGVATHFQGLAAADLPQLRAQLQRMDRALALVRDLGVVERHVANTLGTLLLPEAHADGVRIGGGLYGFLPGVPGEPELQPVLALKARLAAIRHAAAGDPVGYGGTFRCARPSRLGTLPLGYADGLPRASWGGASVLVRGRKVPIVGLVSMNQTVVDITEVPAAALGDEVVLLGAQGGERLRPESLVAPGGSAYEVTTLLSPALPRRVVGGLRPADPCPAG